MVWLDVLRGAALFGIAQINFPSFAAGPLPTAALYAATPSAALVALNLALSFFVSAKFYPIFAFLFGYGHALQRRRLEATGRDAAVILQRRYLALLVLGLCHGTVLFFGDILTMYALAGLVLLMFGGRARTAIRRWAALAALIALVTALSQVDQPATVHHEWVLEHLAELQQLRGAMLTEVLLARAQLFLAILAEQLITFLPLLLIFMSAGVWACEQGVLQHPEQHRRLFLRLLAIGFGIGVPINLALAYGELLILREQAAIIPEVELLSDLAFVLSLGYLGGVGLYAARTVGRVPAAPLRWLAAMGRVALTNYVVQSLVMSFGWYLGWRELDGPELPIKLAALALLVCVLQGFWSQQRLRAAAHGPLEALWRRITYGPASAG